jgi:hypothetical protein
VPGRERRGARATFIAVPSLLVQAAHIIVGVRPSKRGSRPTLGPERLAPELAAGAAPSLDNVIDLALGRE